MYNIDLFLSGKKKLDLITKFDQYKAVKKNKLFIWKGLVIPFYRFYEEFLIPWYGQ